MCGVYGDSWGSDGVWSVCDTVVLLRILENGQPLAAGCLLEEPVRDASDMISVLIPVDA